MWFFIHVRGHAISVRIEDAVTDFDGEGVVWIRKIRTNEFIGIIPKTLKESIDWVNFDRYPNDTYYLHEIRDPLTVEPKRVSVK